MLEVEERREDFEEGEGEREAEAFAALGDKDRFASEAGVEARELALLNGSDFARMRLRASSGQYAEIKEAHACLHLSGGLSASTERSCFAGSKLACREGGAKSMLISGGDMVSA